MKGIDRYSTLRVMSSRAIVMFGMLALAACGGGYGGGGNKHKPTVTLSASPTTITLGQSTTLTWTSSVGTSCTASGAPCSLRRFAVFFAHDFVFLVVRKLSASPYRVLID